MRNLAIALLAAVFTLASCSSQSPSPKPDPVAVASASATLACGIVAAEKPEVVPAFVTALDKALEVLDSEDPTAAAILVGLNSIDDPQARGYAAGVVHLALVLFPNIPTTADLPPQYIEGAKAALVSCRNVVAPTTTTSTSTTSTTLVP